MPNELNFWDSEAWAPILIIGLRLVSMLAALAASFVLLNVVLFRRSIFRRNKKSVASVD